MTDIANENRRLRSAQHAAALDLDLALHGLKGGDIATAQEWVERALERLYRERPAPSGLLEQLRASVHLLTRERAA